MRTVQVLFGEQRLCVAEVADGRWTRFRGLLGRKSLAPGRGLLIQPCKSVHTFFMQFPIDVVYLTRDGLVTKTRSCMVPSHLSVGERGTYCVLELPEGSIEAAGLQAGQRFDIVPDVSTDQGAASTLEGSP
jgi:uncharacterized protein